MRGEDPQPASPSQLSILVPTVIGLALCVVGGTVAADAIDGLQGLPRPRNLLEAAAVKIARDEMLYRLVAAAIALVIGAGVLMVYVPTVRLKENARRLRPFAGRTKATVIAVLGEPREIERDPETKKTRGTWRTPLYSVTLEFEAGVCLGATRERR